MFASLGELNMFTDKTFPFTEETQIVPEVLVRGL